jgi:hypothetical protein
MARQRVDRRTFVKAMAGSTALPVLAAGGTERAVAAARRSGVEQSTKPRLKFAVIGINHNHINSQVGAVLRGGGELVWLYAKEPDLVKDFQKRFPQAKLARSEDEVLQDSSIQLVLSSAIPPSARQSAFA